jgi:hypothetical protein
MRHNPGRGIMGHFMGEGAVKGFGILEGGEGRHLHDIGGGRIERPVAAMADRGPCVAEKPFQPCVAVLHGFGGRLRLGVVMRGQAVDLLHVKGRVGLHERDLPLDLLPAVRLGLGLGEGVGIDDQRAVFALAHLRAQLLRLLVGHPDRARKPLFEGGTPQQQDIDAPVGLAVTA